MGRTRPEQSPGTETRGQRTVWAWQALEERGRRREGVRKVQGCDSEA